MRSKSEQGGGCPFEEGSMVLSLVRPEASHTGSEWRQSRERAALALEERRHSPSSQAR